MRESDSNNVSKKKNVSKKGNQVDQSVIDLAKKIEKADPAFEPEALYSKKYAANLFDDDELLGSEYSDDSDELDDDSDFEVDKQILKEQDKNKKSSKGKSNSNEEVLINFDDDNTSENIFNVNEEELDIKLNENKATKKGKAISRDSKKVENEVNNINNDDYGFMKDFDDDNEPEKEDEKVEENKGVIAGNEAPKAPEGPKVEAPKAPKTNEEKYNEKLQIFNDNVKNPYKYYIETYGINGKIDEKINSDKREDYNKIILEPDNKGDNYDLTEEDIVALMFGAVFTKEHIDKNLNTSDIEGANYEIFNTEHLLKDFPVKKDNRDVNYVPELLGARKEVKEAINEYAQGDKTKVNNLMSNFVNFAPKIAGASSGSYSVRNAIDTFPIELALHAVCLADKISKDKRFTITDNRSRDKLANCKYKSLVKQTQAKISAENGKETLLNGLKNATLDAKSKEELVANIIFNDYVASISKDASRKINAKADKMIDDFCVYHGCDNDPDSISSFQLNHIDLFQATEKMVNTLGSTTVSDFEGVLAQDNGVDTLKSLYMNEIKKSDTYKKMMDATNEKDMIAALKGEEKNTFNKGLSSFENVKVPDGPAKTINDSISYSRQNMINSVFNKMENALFNEVLVEDKEKYGFSSVEPEGLVKNAASINQMYKDIKSVNRWTSSPNFEAMVTALKELKDFTDERAKSGLPIGSKEKQIYVKKIKAVDDAARNYLENKTNLNSDYAKRRFKAVGMLRSHLKSNLSAFDNAIDAHGLKVKNEVLKEYASESMLKYTIDGEIMINVMKGEKNKDLNMRSLKSHSGFSVNRSAIQNLVIHSLALKGYSIDDIMEPDKLNKVKEEEFEKAKNLMTGESTKEKREEIARIYTDAYPIMNNMVNEYFKGVDMTKPVNELMKDDKYQKLACFDKARFDGWQEMAHVSDEMIALCKNKDVKTKNQMTDYYGKNLGALGEINSFYFKLLTTATSIKSTGNPIPADYGLLADDAINVAAGIQVFKDTVKENPNMSFTEIIREMGPKTHGLTNATAMNRNARNFKEMVGKNPDEAKYCFDGFMDLSYFKDTNFKVTYDNNIQLVSMQVDNLKDSAEDFKNKAEDYKFLRKADAALKRLSANQYTNKKEFIKDSAIAITGQLYRISGKRPVNEKDNTKMSLTDYSKKLIKTDGFVNSLRNSQHPEKWKSGKNVYDSII